ncbi:MAG TPA: flagellar hook capping FlgD N-terminal domain-containing protein [Candidatus Sulfopaludibacter sp.]|nr:flagellar hook capping FlgD N-terminal domain-containing protein [Candidatus Sulfopaludibacter sp.]
MSSIPAITNYTSNTGSSDSVSGPQQTLNQNDFLQLLVTQMENQDPLDPQSDTQMAAEMAQFSSLQENTAMAGSLSALQANSLVGSTVTLQTGPQTTVSGTVSGVLLGSASSDGTPQIVVNGTAYDLSQVLTITPTSNTTPNASGSGGTGFDSNSTSP